MVRKRPTPWLHRWSRPIILFLATIGLLDTGYITLEKFGIIQQTACPLFAGGCTQVLNSSYAFLFGQPLSLFGAIAYFSVGALAALPLFVKTEQAKSLRLKLEKVTWLLLFLLSTAMVVFSGYLIYLMAYEIKAFCFFCIGSALLSLGIFLVSLFGHDWEDLGQVLFGGFITAIAVVVTLLGIYAGSSETPALADQGQVGPPIVTVSKPAAVSLAEYLTQTGAKMYSAYWCPHCHDQKELFGQEAVKKLDIVECDPQGRNARPQLCQQAGIQGFPTWEIDGKQYSGTRPLQELASLSGYTGPQNF